MFEKEAEEYIKANNLEWELECHRTSPIGEVKQAYIDGAEFGYKKGLEFGVKSNEKVNKIVANEWHYVKDGDLPNTETKNYTYIRRRKRYERQFTDYRVIKCFVLCQNEKGKITAEVGYFDCNQKCFFDKAEGIVIAWKEIELPELKESE